MMTLLYVGIGILSAAGTVSVVTILTMNKLDARAARQPPINEPRWDL